jgi:hypothetical protein
MLFIDVLSNRETYTSVIYVSISILWSLKEKIRKVKVILSNKYHGKRNKNHLKSKKIEAKFKFVFELLSSKIYQNSQCV